MAESKMNKAYWVAHKAKTLLDSGDTVAKALELWDKDKAKSPQNWNPDLMATVLLNVSLKAGALEAKANSVIHKETKALLKSYKEDAKSFSDAIKAATGKELACLEGHRSRVSSLAFSPDGLRLASGSYDNTVKLWEVSSGKEINSLLGHKFWVTSVVFSPDGSRLYFSSQRGKTGLVEDGVTFEITGPF